MERPQPHQIFVHCIEARGVTSLDQKGLSDIQCHITIGPKTRYKKVTHTKFSTANSVWNEKFVFENVMLTEEEWKREKIGLNVMDRNDFTANSHIGGVEFSLTNVYRQKNHEYYRKWTPLVRADEPGKDHGWIQVSVYVLKKGDTTPSHGNDYEHINEKDPVLRAPSDTRQSLYLLNVLLYRGEGLLPTHQKNLNPFVNVRFNGTTIQTKRMANIRNPIWNRKMIMPFQLPLHSDSIEIQVWNDNTMTPDTLIGQKTFSFYGERLQNRPYGPGWINLYSSHYIPPKTTFLGRMMNVLGKSQYIGEDEYVGRLLIRLSVRRVDAIMNPRLRCIPCPPAVEPSGVEYSLDFFIYSGSEIPVQGGKVFVEIVFGSARRCTKELIAERPGEYSWSECFKSINDFGPQKLKEVHDVIINVYHKAGYASRKIAFERIPVASLMKGIGYYIDGQPYSANKIPAPRWRALQNITYDEKRPHIIAGFLLCNIGFGLKHMRPKTLPDKILKPKIKNFVLRFYIHQGVNIPAACDDGTTDPFVLVRFAGRNQLIECRPQPTRYPYYHQMVEIEAQVDPAHIPSVILMVYHKYTGGHKLVGRCEINSEDILPPKEYAKARLDRKTQIPTMTKYPLKVVDDLNGKHQSDFGDMTPCIIGQIQLVEQKDVPDLIPGWQRKDGVVKFDAPFRCKRENDDNARTYIMSPYALKVECVGLREIAGTGYEYASNPQIGVGFPPDMEIEEEKRPIKIMQNSAANVMEQFVFPRIPVPKYSLSATPLVLSFYDGNTLISSCYTPLSRFLGASGWDVAMYKPGYERENKDMKSVGTLLNELKTEETQRIRKEFKMKEKEERREDDGIDKKKIRLTELCNVNAEFVAFKGRKGVTSAEQNEVKESDEKTLMANEMELRPELMGKRDPFHHDFKLFRGRSVGLRSSKIKEKLYVGDKKASTNPQDHVGTMKTFVQLVPVTEGKETAVAEMYNQRLMKAYDTIQSKSYICRIYVYRACNLSPRKHFVSNTCNAYVIIKNGEEEHNQFSNVKNASKGDVNPGIYQVIELHTKLPQNGTLSIQIWDHDDYASDVLIGTTEIDVEQRLLRGIERGVKEYRPLLNPKYSTSQGLVLVKVDILTEEEARTIKAEELSAPQILDYQLRLVLWETKSVRYPQLEKKGDDVDQKIVVTANFDGEAGQDILKQTDTAWYAAGGNAPWNYRMIFNLKLPCKNPRLTISVWDENLLGSSEAIGEVVINLREFFARCLLEKAGRTREKTKVVAFEHANYRGINLGNLSYEMAMYTRVEADENPAGEAQNEPNIDPYLPNPYRNAPPWAVGSRTLDWIAGQRRLIIIIAVVVLLCALFVPIVLLTVTA